MTTLNFEMSRPMRIGTAILMKLLHAGVPMGPLKLLGHVGRKSGRFYTTPVALVHRDGERWLVAAFGEVNWVHNIRATGEATFIRGNQRETVAIEEISNHEAAPILKQFLTQFGIVPFIPPYFEVDKRASLANFEREAKRHPVFHLKI